MSAVFAHSRACVVLRLYCLPGAQWRLQPRQGSADGAQPWVGRGCGQGVGKVLFALHFGAPEWLG